MDNTTKLTRAALVSAIALAFSAATFAQSAGSPGGDSGGQTKAGATATTGTTAPGAAGSTATTPPTSTSRGAADNTNSRSGPGVADTWVTKYAAEHKGRISRQAYMDEMGRRFDTMDKAKQGGITRQAYIDDLTRQWEAMDRNNQGLTPAEVSRLTGKVDVDHASPPRTGSGVQAGDMGPSSVKGK